jgi:alpha-methylacyl-CoA racemase
VDWESENGMDAGPLAGVRILDLCRLLPGGFATALLGDLGAEVIKVEQPGVGDHQRAYEPRIGEDSAYSWVTDRNKRSLVLDLKDPRGVAALHRLAERADALIESFRPGVADRLGIGYDALRAVNPALVYCSISGYGADGPLARVAGHDINYIGRAGILSVTGREGRPTIPGVQIADVAGGGLMSVAGVLAALVRARETGEGDHVDVSMTDAAFASLSIHWGAYFATGEAPGHEDGLLTGRYPSYNVYECADGRHVTVGALEGQFFAELCRRVGRPDLEPTRLDRAALPLWREIFLERTRDEWLDRFAGSDACVGPVNDFGEALADPQLGHRGMVVETEHREVGPVPQVAPPIKLREHPAAVRHPAPRLGEDTRQVLAEAGMSPEEVDALIADGVAAEPLPLPV